MSSSQNFTMELDYTMKTFKKISIPLLATLFFVDTSFATQMYLKNITLAEVDNGVSVFFANIDIDENFNNIVTESTNICSRVEKCVIIYLREGFRFYRNRYISNRRNYMIEIKDNGNRLGKFEKNQNRYGVSMYCGRFPGGRIRMTRSDHVVCT
jgi:hypothetical protein